MKIQLILALLFLFNYSIGKSNQNSEEAFRHDSLMRIEIQNLQQELESLNQIRLQKADSLEKKEALHWGKRYKESSLTDEHQVESRELDSRYSKLSTDLSRISEEFQASKEMSLELEETAKIDEESLDAFNTQIKLSIDKSLEDLMGDFPIGMNQRLINLKKAQKESSKKIPNSNTALKEYFNDLLLRHEMTYTQFFGQIQTQVGTRPDVYVYRLRLGTVFLGDAATDNGEIQALLRTGTLQGKRFEWNSDLPKDMNDAIRTAINNAYKEMSNSNTAFIDVPIDVLQNKTIKNSISNKNQESIKTRFLEWFKKGGVVMYPLMLVALFSLLLCLERFIVLTHRGYLGKNFQKQLDLLINQENYEKAANLCLKKNTSLSMVLFSVLNKVRETRESAERSLQEALLREQPKLDRRMGLLAAMGTIAPLLGLLGTVTGIITLFKVITEVGTNDARVLAGGISEALITTETGLIIAIPVMILHGLLSEKIERVTSELYVQSATLLNRLFKDEKHA